MTHGEAYMENRDSARLENGEVVFDKDRLPKRMGRKEAEAYYNDKLFNYWLSELDEKIPNSKQRDVLNVMLGRTA